MGIEMDLRRQKKRMDEKKIPECGVKISGGGRKSFFIKNKKTLDDDS
jgi:hypothetical protein